MTVYVSQPATQPDGSRWCYLYGTDRRELEEFAVLSLRLSRAALLPGSPTRWALPGRLYETAIDKGAKRLEERE